MSASQAVYATVIDAAPARRAVQRPRSHRGRLFAFAALLGLSVVKSIAAWGREQDDMPAHHERLACAHSPSCAPHRAGGVK
jgi:hypothetical protein